MGSLIEEERATRPTEEQWVIGPEELFERMVLDDLNYGGVFDMPSLKQYAVGDGPFSALYEPEAYVLQRSSSDYPEYDKEYNKRIQRLVQEVESIMGFAPKVIKYSKPTSAHPDFWKGIAYFQYDPVGDDTYFQYDPVGDDSDCKVQFPSSRLWVEDRVVTSMTWFGHDDQLVNVW